MGEVEKYFFYRLSMLIFNVGVFASQKLQLKHKNSGIHAA
jgi:hypothetical protein